MQNIKLSLLILLSILLFGTFGYMGIEGSSFLDGMYMTVITITTVGYAEVVPLHPVGKVFTMVLVLVGVSFVLYVFGKITEAVVEGGLRKAFGRINMDNKLAKVSGHYIVCGYGRIGRVICQSLHDDHRDFVVIENNPEEIKSLSTQGYLWVEGEAADDDVLIQAGIKRAKGLIAVVSSDAENVYITMTAKDLNHDLFVMGRSSGKKGADTKLLRAGADKVISPYYIGARQMANMVLRPTVIDFLDLTVHGALGLRLEELMVPESTSIANMTLMDSGIRKKYDLIVVAIKRQGENEMLFNPSHLTVIKPGDIIIVLGELDNIKRLEKEL
ncbi:MAG: potassium channel protein [Proteobacteria bacterium]|nr:potassium channel protein [Desulfobulbaceae bacterium]MBU4153358.1 potassium channel protein [Pseudomonadota bacterium]